MRAEDSDAARIAGLLAAYRTAYQHYQDASARLLSAEQARRSLLARVGLRGSPPVVPLREEADAAARALSPIEEELRTVERRLQQPLLAPAGDAPAGLSRLGERLLARLSTRGQPGLGSLEDWLANTDDAPARVHDFAALVVARARWLRRLVGTMGGYSAPFAAIALGRETPEEEARYTSLFQRFQPRSPFDPRRGLGGALVVADCAARGIALDEWTVQYERTLGARLSAGLGQGMLGVALLSLRAPEIIGRLPRLRPELKRAVGWPRPEELPLMSSLCVAVPSDEELLARVRQAKAHVDALGSQHGIWFFTERAALVYVLAHHPDPAEAAARAGLLRARAQATSRRLVSWAALGLLAVSPGEAEPLLAFAQEAASVLRQDRALGWLWPEFFDGAAAMLVLRALFADDPTPGGGLLQAMGYSYMERIVTIAAS